MAGKSPVVDLVLVEKVLASHQRWTCCPDCRTILLACVGLSVEEMCVLDVLLDAHVDNGLADADAKDSSVYSRSCNFVSNSR